ncbi:MAG TPA: hypothetical protein VFJ16_03400 [Longimicrobium sp.]|nr:hypothetical protein [Longimicrobium sp.]
MPRLPYAYATVAVRPNLDQPHQSILALETGPRRTIFQGGVHTAHASRGHACPCSPTVAEMVQFANRQAYEQFIRNHEAGGVQITGIRWFREPGAWVERARPRSSLPVLSAATPLLPPARIRWMLND